MQRSSHAADGGDRWVWKRLQESLQDIKVVRVESQHLQASTQTLLDRQPFSPQHDERILRFKAQACTSAMNRLLSAVESLEGQIGAALHARDVEEAAWQRQQDEALASGQLLLVELQRAESELVLEKERSAVAISREKETQHAELMHKAQTAMNDQAEEWTQLVEELGAAADASAATSDTLHEELAALREENAMLRESAVQLRGEATRKVAEALSNERAEATAKFGAMQDKIALQSDPNPNPLTLTLTQVRCKTRLLGCSRTTPSCARPPSSCAAT